MKKIVFTMMVLAALVFGSAQAQIIQFDYGATAAQAGFTQINIAAGTGVSSGVSISNNGDGLEFRDRTTQINGEGFGSDPLFNLLSDIAFENDATSIVFTLTGLTAFQEYTVVGYGYDADFSNDTIVNNWTTNGGTVSHGWEHEDISTASFSLANLTADASGVATITGSTNVGSLIIWNGFQITAVPEPSSFALMALGGVALFILRRGARQG